jgi:phospholipid/cholesterol/gamma-HCH transport system ATP-binding protein
MIATKDLRKSLGGRPVLEGINLTVSQGRLTAIIGSSGAGKSVLLRHLMGLMRPDAGVVEIDGQDLARLPRQELERLRSRFGVLFQGGALFDFLTVLDNVAFPLVEKGILDLPHSRAEAMNELEAVGLADAADKHPLELSGGMRKRAALARALVGKPEVALFDEPTTGLDPLLLGSIHDLIAQSHDRLGFTGVVVSHEIPEIFDIADQVAMLEQGVIVETGTPEQISSSVNPVVRRFVRPRRQRR